MRETLIGAQKQFERYCQSGLTINMARGVPSSEQLDLSMGLLEHSAYLSRDGIDCRNYMGQQGLPEARALFAPVLGVAAEQVVVGGNSSLAMMYDTLQFAWRHGTTDSVRPWSSEERVAFICPVPGYDRHFKLLEDFGIDMIPVDLTNEGPEMDQVRALARRPNVKGMWCVPKYSNPTGAVYSEETITALASMPTGAADFRLFWDDAYCLHHLTPERISIANVSHLCEAAGHANRALVFASTSKMTFAGAGLGLLGSSAANIAWWLGHASIASVGPDKLNQLRHVAFLKNLEGLAALMDRHREILAPKFQVIDEVFSAHLSTHRWARWTKPKGGYFISVHCKPGTARRVVALAKQAGIILTAAGAAFPYGEDPLDSHLRIAPSSLPLAQVRIAAQVIATCMTLAAQQ